MYQVSQEELTKLLLNQSDKHVCELMLKKVQGKYKALQDIWKRYAIDSKYRYQDLNREYRSVKKELKSTEEELSKTINALNLAQKKENKMKLKINKHNLEDKLRERRTRRTRKR